MAFRRAGRSFALIPTGGHLFGFGSDGLLVFDGVSTVAGIAPVGGLYTMPDDLDPLDMIIDAGVVVHMNNFRVFGSPTGTLTCNGTLHNNGNSAVGMTAGAATVAQMFPATIPGGAGRNVAGSANVGSNSTNCHRSWANDNVANGTPSTGIPFVNTAKGRGGGSGGDGSIAGGVGGSVSVQGPTANGGLANVDAFYLSGKPSYSGGTPVSYGAGGAGGRLTGAGVSGGGGAGGGGGFVSFGRMVGRGVVSCNGGNGADGVSGGGQAGGGGGGGGGWLTLYYLARRLAATADGGRGGNGDGGGHRGGNGGPGTVRYLNLSGDGS